MRTFGLPRANEMLRSPGGLELYGTRTRIMNAVRPLTLAFLLASVASHLPWTGAAVNISLDACSSGRPDCANNGAVTACGLRNGATLDYEESVCACERLYDGAGTLYLPTNSRTNSDCFINIETDNSEVGPFLRIRALQGTNARQQPTHFSNWNSSDLANESCVSVDIRTGKWQTLPCTSRTSLLVCLDTTHGSCGDPGHLPNGTRTGDEFIIGSVVSYECNPGFQLDGNASITCLDSVMWSSRMPTCNEIRYQFANRAFRCPNSSISFFIPPSTPTWFHNTSNAYYPDGRERCASLGNADFPETDKESLECARQYITILALEPENSGEFTSSTLDGPPTLYIYGSNCTHLSFRYDVKVLQANVTTMEPGFWSCSNRRLPLRNFCATRDDIDECELNAHNCTSNTTCRNTDGGFLCIESPTSDQTVVSDVTRLSCQEAERNRNLIEVLERTTNNTRRGSDARSLPDALLNVIRHIYQPSTTIGPVTRALERLVFFTSNNNITTWYRLVDELLIYGERLLLTGTQFIYISASNGTNNDEANGLYAYHTDQLIIQHVFYYYDDSLQLNINRTLKAREAEIEIATHQNRTGAQTAVIFAGSRRPFRGPNNICTETIENRDVAVFERWFRTHSSDGVIRFATRVDGIGYACVRFNLIRRCFQTYSTVLSNFSTGEVVNCTIDRPGTYTLVMIRSSYRPVTTTAPTTRLTPDAMMSLADRDDANLASLRRFLSLILNRPVDEEAVRLGVMAIENVLHPTSSLPSGGVVRQILDHLSGGSPDVFQSANSNFNASSRLLNSSFDFWARVLIPYGETWSSTSGANVSTAILAVRHPSETNVTASVAPEMFMTPDGDIMFQMSMLFPDKMKSSNDISVVLPGNVSQLASRSQDQTATNIQFAVFNSPEPFFMDQNESRQVSSIVSVQVGTTDIGDLGDSNATLMFTLDPIQDEDSFECAFWDFQRNGGAGGWSTEGCSRRNVTDIANASGRLSQVKCECSHLTSFAVLFTADGADDLPLLLITAIGAGVSLAFLLFLVATIILFRRLRREMRMKILLQLCLSYSIVTLLLVLMSVARDNEAACTAFSVLLHYLVLVSIAWTSAEAFYLHGVLINVYGKEVNHYFLKLCAFAWGVPLLIVLITAATDKFSFDNYYEAPPEGKTAICFLVNEPNKYYFYFGFLLPLCLALAFNLVIFIRLVFTIRSKSSSAAGAGKGSSDTRRQVLTALSVAVIIGFNWFLSLGLVRDEDSEPSIVLVYVFAIIMALFGVVVFLLHVVFRQEVRQAWRTHPVTSSIMSKISAVSFSSGSNAQTKASQLASTSAGSRAKLSISSSAQHLSVPMQATSYVNSGSTVTDGDGKRETLASNGTGTSDYDPPQSPAPASPAPASPAPASPAPAKPTKPKPTMTLPGPESPTTSQSPHSPASPRKYTPSPTAPLSPVLPMLPVRRESAQVAICSITRGNAAFTKSSTHDNSNALSQVKEAPVNSADRDPPSSPNSTENLPKVSVKDLAQGLEESDVRGVASTSRSNLLAEEGEDKEKA